MTLFRVHYEALQPPRFTAGERRQADIDANTPDAARKALSERFEHLHRGCKPVITKIKRLRTI